MAFSVSSVMKNEIARTAITSGSSHMQVYFRKANASGVTPRVLAWYW